MLGHKINLRKFKNKTISSIFSKYNDMKLEISNKKKNWKICFALKLNNTLLNNQLVKEESKVKS